MFLKLGEKYGVVWVCFDFNFDGVFVSVWD